VIPYLANKPNFASLIRPNYFTRNMKMVWRLGGEVEGNLPHLMKWGHGMKTDATVRSIYDNGTTVWLDVDVREMSEPHARLQAALR
jgi:hypothetical protein